MDTGITELPEWAGWRAYLLRALGIELDVTLMSELGAWAGSRPMPPWSNNPLAAGRKILDAVVQTEFGVMSYPTVHAGVMATMEALNEPPNRVILDALKNHAGYADLHAAIRQSVWPWVAIDAAYPHELLRYEALVNPGTVTPVHTMAGDGLSGGVIPSSAHVSKMASVTHMRGTAELADAYEKVAQSTIRRVTGNG